MAITDTDLKDAARTGLHGALQHQSVQENDRVLQFQDPEKLLSIAGKVGREGSAKGRSYGGPRRLRVDFSNTDR